MMPVIGAIVAAIWNHKLLDGHEADMRKLIMPAVCRFIGGLEYSRQPRGISSARFKKAGLIGSSNQDTLQDAFTGQHQHTSFAMADAKFEKSHGRYSETLFHGLLMEIDLPAAFSGRVLILPKGSIMARLWRRVFPVAALKQLVPISARSDRFRNCFEAYADNAANGRHLLTPSIEKALVEIDLTFPPKRTANILLPRRRKSPQAAYYENRLLLAIPMNEDLFRPGTLWRSVNSCTDDIRVLLKEVLIAHYVIDLLEERS